MTQTVERADRPADVETQSTPSHAALDARLLAGPVGLTDPDQPFPLTADTYNPSLGNLKELTPLIATNSNKERAEFWESKTDVQDPYTAWKEQMGRSITSLRTFYEKQDGEGSTKKQDRFKTFMRHLGDAMNSTDPGWLKVGKDKDGKEEYSSEMSDRFYEHYFLNGSDIDGIISDTLVATQNSWTELSNSNGATDQVAKDDLLNQRDEFMLVIFETFGHDTSLLMGRIIHIEDSGIDISKIDKSLIEASKLSDADKQLLHNVAERLKRAEVPAAEPIIATDAPRPASDTENTALEDGTSDDPSSRTDEELTQAPSATTTTTTTPPPATTTSTTTAAPEATGTTATPEVTETSDDTSRDEPPVEEDDAEPTITTESDTNASPSPTTAPPITTTAQPVPTEAVVTTPVPTTQPPDRPVSKPSTTETQLTTTSTTSTTTAQPYPTTIPRTTLNPEPPTPADDEHARGTPPDSDSVTEPVIFEQPVPTTTPEPTAVSDTQIHEDGPTQTEITTPDPLVSTGDNGDVVPEIETTQPTEEDIEADIKEVKKAMRRSMQRSGTYTEEQIESVTADNLGEVFADQVSKAKQELQKLGINTDSDKDPDQVLQDHWDSKRDERENWLTKDQREKKQELYSNIQSDLKQTDSQLDATLAKIKEDKRLEAFGYDTSTPQGQEAFARTQEIAREQEKQRQEAEVAMSATRPPDHTAAATEPDEKDSSQPGGPLKWIKEWFSKSEGDNGQEPDRTEREAEEKQVTDDLGEAGEKTPSEDEMRTNPTDTPIGTFQNEADTPATDGMGPTDSRGLQEPPTPAPTMPTTGRRRPEDTANLMTKEFLNGNIEKPFAAPPRPVGKLPTDEEDDSLNLASKMGSKP